MKAVLDVHYRGGGAMAACVAFDSWQDSLPAEIIRAAVPPVPHYRAGRFYERELPCLLAVLQSAAREFEIIVIDGYVHLRADAGKGLGAHLYESLSCATAVVGVAKKPLKVADRFVTINRGRGSKPLFVSAAGCPVDYAAQSVSGMHGPYRIPTLLRIADQQARG